MFYLKRKDHSFHWLIKEIVSLGNRNNVHHYEKTVSLWPVGMSPNFFMNFPSV